MPPRSGSAQAVVLGVTFPALLVGGFMLGKWAGRWLGLGEWTAILGAGIGVLGAFFELFRWATRKGDE
jgi:hypothetical protein